MSILTKAPGEEACGSKLSGARDGGEREAPQNSNSIRLHRAQELRALAAAGVDVAHCVRLYPMPQPWIASATVG